MKIKANELLTNYQTLKKFFLRAIRKFIRTIFEFLPISINKMFALKGYTYLISRKKSFHFISNIYGTDLKINAHSLSNIDRVATSNKSINDDFVYSYSDPIYGIFTLNLKNWVMIDIGANIGTYSIACVAAGAEEIYAIEPGNTFTRLKENVKLNNLDNIISTFNFGIANFEGNMKWYEELSNIGNAHLVKDIKDIDLSKTKTLLNKKFLEVKVKKLNSFIKENNINKIDLIKIDVEGMEFQIIESIEEIIKIQQPIFLIETHRIMSDIVGYDCITPIFNKMYKNNYESYHFNGNKFEKFLYPNFPMDTFFIPKNKHDITR